MEKEKIGKISLWLGVIIAIAIFSVEVFNIHQFSKFHPIRGLALILIGASLVIEFHDSSKYRRLLFLVALPYFIITILFLGGAYKTMETVLGFGDLVSFILLAVITIPTVIVILYLIMKSSRVIARYLSIEIDSTEDSS